MSDETKPEVPERVRRMDQTAEALQKVIEDPKTSELHKSRLFQQLLSYETLRVKLMATQDGNKILEMQNGLKSKGGERGGSARKPRATGAGVGAKNSRAIRELMRSLPRIGASKAAAGNGGGADGDTEDTGGEGGGGAGDSGGNGADILGNAKGNGHGIGDRRVV